MKLSTVPGVNPTGNFGAGVRIANSPRNVIGGTEGTSPGESLAGAGNLISGNNGGIVIKGDTARENRLEGNYLGTDRMGTRQLGGGGAGIEIDAPANTIGGDVSAARNIISGHGTWGVTIRGIENKVVGNYIGNHGSSPALADTAHADSAVGLDSAHLLRRNDRERAGGDAGRSRRFQEIPSI